MKKSEKMKNIILTLTFFLITFLLTRPIRADGKSNSDPGSRTFEDADLNKVMAECNKSFTIEMSYIEALNNSGSFPDETDKTPKCYVRCVMENMGIMSTDGVFDPERVAVIFAGQRDGRVMTDIQQIALTCSDRNETCKCEKAYNFMKCLMTKEIEKYEKKAK